MTDYKNITKEEIKDFLEGHDKQEHIVNIECGSSDDHVTIHYRDDNFNKCVSEEPFYPFLWAKLSTCIKLKISAEEKARSVSKNGESELFYYDYELTRDGRPYKKKKYAKNLNEYLRGCGIWCKSLNYKNLDGSVNESLENGYTMLFYAITPMSNSRFLSIFKTLGHPVYSDRNDDVEAKASDKSQYLTVTPVEQYLISSGKRFFKGYNDYNDILRMTFDEETTGLDTEKDRIKQLGISFNRPVHRQNENEFYEFKRILSVTGNTKEELDKSELELIRETLQIIYTFKPDIITAHNGENFDWNVLVGACKRLGTTLEEESKPYFNGKSIYKNKNESSLKLGGEVEKFHQTIVPGITITDSLHAVRRAQATDSNFASATLKYACQYLGIAKKNRVYTPGDKIDEILCDLEEHYAFNDENGNWYLYDPDCQNSNREITPGKVGNNPFIMYRRNFVADGYKLASGKYVIERYLYDDLWECDAVEYRLNTSAFFLCKLLPLPFQKCCTMGTAGQWKSLMLAWSYENDLAIPELVQNKKFVGGLSRLMKVGFVPKCVKYDFNSLYPATDLTWGIGSSKDSTGIMLKFLEYFLAGREKYKKLKKEADKKVSAFEERINNGEKLAKEELAEYAKARADFELNDKIQNSFKVFCNSYFGSLGSQNGGVFPWSDVEAASKTTCTSRQSLRLMISHFANFGYTPIVGDTDGFNFKIPKTYRYTEGNPYIGKGKSRETKEGNEYYDYNADLAEFNDNFMNSEFIGTNRFCYMGLGLDEVVDSTINFSRKNYADYFPEKPYPKDVKLVGNTIKSKKMAGYIAKFIDKAVRLLLQGNGQGFLEEYYSTVSDIYNYNIPLVDIASKGKVKKNIEEYIEDCKTLTAAGRPKSRQAWMELAIKEGIDAQRGETIYYINTGKSKSHSDCKKVTKYYRVETNLFGSEKTDCTAEIEKAWKKYKKQYPNVTNDKTIADFINEKYKDVEIITDVVLNCKLIPREIIESDISDYKDEDIEYNVPKYIDMFNKRITPLLVCFKPEIRHRILVTNPSDRQYFTNEESELCSGYPNKSGDQDTIEQLMTMDDREIEFWMRHPEWKIPFLKECGMDWESIKTDYEERKEREKQLGIDNVREAYEKALDSLSEDEIDDFYDGIIPQSILKLIDIDPVSGDFMDKNYKDIKIGSISDIIDNIESYSY